MTGFAYCVYTGLVLFPALLRGLAVTTLGSLMGGANPQPGYLKLTTATVVGAPRNMAFSFCSQPETQLRTIGLLVYEVIFSPSRGRSHLGKTLVLARATNKM